MRNYLIKNIPNCFERVKIKRRSLNYEEVCIHPHTFSSGEGGPPPGSRKRARAFLGFGRGVVDEEDIIVLHIG